MRRTKTCWPESSRNSRSNRIEVEQSIKNSNDYQSQALQDILDGKPADVFTAFRGAQFFNMAKANGGSVWLDLSNQRS